MFKCVRISFIAVSKKTIKYFIASLTMPWVMLGLAWNDSERTYQMILFCYISYNVLNFCCSPQRNLIIRNTNFGYTFLRGEMKLIWIQKYLTTFDSARMQSHSGSIHSPHRIRKIIMNEWKKSVKFHLKLMNIEW